MILPLFVDQGQCDAFFKVADHTLATALIGFLQPTGHLQRLGSVGKRHQDILVLPFLGFVDILDHWEGLHRDPVHPTLVMRHGVVEYPICQVLCRKLKRIILCDLHLHGKDPEQGKFEGLEVFALQEFTRDLFGSIEHHIGDVRG